MKPEEKAVMPFAGGIMQHGYQCGMIWGATLAAGAEAYRLFGSGARAEAKAIIAAQSVVASFRDLNEVINCQEITDLDKSSSTMQQIIYFLIKGGTIGCFRMAARYAPVAYEAIDSAFNDEDVDVNHSQVSCASMLARKMRLSDEQMVMVAGLAGGIGLYGGGCGALGTAIWTVGMRSYKRSRKVDFHAPKATALVEKFLECTDFEFECADIVGRKFNDVNDHASYIEGGGCSKIVDTLAAELTTN